MSETTNSQENEVLTYLTDFCLKLKLARKSRNDDKFMINRVEEILSFNFNNDIFIVMEMS